MIAARRDWIPDRFAIATGGHNSGDDPEVLMPDQYADSKNVTMRGGRVMSRPRYTKVADMPTEAFQGIHYYKATGQLVLRAGGKLFYKDPNGATFTEVTGFLSNPFKEMVWFEEVGGILLTQDGQQTPTKFDGASASFSTDTPIGTAMRFANGRLHLASSGTRKNLFIGDIYQQGDPDTALKFTETTYLLGGGSFAYAEPITALHEIPLMDTASGQGSMVIGTSGSCHSLRTEITSRDLWGQVEGFARPLLPEIGVAGPRSFSVVNNDLYFRTANGFRSLRAAVGEQQSPGYGGLHQEIPEKFYGWGSYHNSTIHFDDRVLTLVHPRLVDGKWVYDGAVVVNFQSINRLGQKSPLAFDGYWELEEGHYFRQVLTGGDRSYAVVKTPTGDELWELHTDGYEFTGEDPTQTLVTRKMNAGDPNGLKDLARMDIWISKIRSNVAMDFSFRADDGDWTLWHTLQVNYTQGGKDFVPRFTLPSPPDEGTRGYSLQFKVEWTGRCRIDYLVPYLKPLAESAFMELETPITLT